MRYAIINFRGEVPAIHDRALPENFAALAENVRFESAIMEPLNATAEVTQTLADAATIHLFDGQWLSWPTLVDAARAPVAESRIYYTGDGAPKVRSGPTVYDLALPAPVSAPTAANLTSPSPELIDTTVFVYTHVTSLGEESPPSTPSAGLDTAPGVVVRIDGFASAPSGRGIVARRIYRSVTSASGITGFYFVAEIPLATTLFDHDIVALPVAEALPSTDYDPPPATLLGLTAMPNGMMAAFDGRDVYFCEPYRPHAWPQKYVLTVDFPVIALCAFGSYLAVLTSGTPYVMQGTHPESMASEKLDASVPCLSRQGVVDIGMAAYFPSTEGLIQISPNGMRNVTDGIFSRRQWLAFSPETIKAERVGEDYMFLRTVSAFDTYFGGTATGWITTPDNLLGGSAGSVPGTILSGGEAATAFGEQKLGVLQKAGQDNFFVRLDAAAPLAMHNDPVSGEVYMLESDKRTIVRWDDREAEPLAAKWRSKRLTTPFPESFSVLLVKTARKLITGDTFSAKIFANGALISTVTRANEPVRIAAALAEEWEIEVESTVGVVAVTIAQSVDEAMGVAA